MLRATLSILLFIALAGCEEPLPEPLVDPNEGVVEIAEIDPDAPHETIPIVGEGHHLVSSAPPPPPPILPAARRDFEYAGDEPIQVRRFVYQVHMIVPVYVGVSNDHFAPSSAELTIESVDDRLRARFSDGAWPVPRGTEVRLRREYPGVYLFDDRGGRPLEPGELATAFEGESIHRRGPPLRIYAYHPRAYPPDESAAGELVCALLAELAGQPREEQAWRCAHGAPYLFRFGFWRGELKASLVQERPRSAMRADELQAPALPEAVDGARFLEPPALARINSRRRRSPVEGPLWVSNETAQRAIVIVQGTSVGWVAPRSRFRFDGLRSGRFQVGAIRPLGAVIARGQAVDVPGEIRLCIGRCQARTPDPAPSSASSSNR